MPTDDELWNQAHGTTSPQGASSGLTDDQLWDQAHGKGPTASSVAPPPIAKKQQSWVDIPPVRSALANWQWMTQTPVAHGLNALVNATSAAGTGFVAGLGQKDTTALPQSVRSSIPPAGQYAISPFSSAFNAVKNPGTLIDTAHQAEQRIGLPSPLWWRC